MQLVFKLKACVEVVRISLAAVVAPSWALAY